MADGRLTHFSGERRPLSSGVLFLGVNKGIVSSGEDESQSRLSRRQPGRHPQMKNGGIWTCPVIRGSSYVEADELPVAVGVDVYER